MVFYPEILVIFSFDNSKKQCYTLYIKRKEVLSMIETITATAKIVVDYEELVEEYRDRVPYAGEYNPDAVISCVVDDYFLCSSSGVDLVTPAGVELVVPAETVRNVKKKLKEILF
jgi:hypothetical protein